MSRPAQSWGSGQVWSGAQIPILPQWLTGQACPECQFLPPKGPSTRGQKGAPKPYHQKCLFHWSPNIHPQFFPPVLCLRGEDGGQEGAVLKQRAVPRKMGCGDRDTEDTGWLGPGQGEVGACEPAAGAEVQGRQDAARRGSLRLGAALQGPGGTRRCSWSKAGQQRDWWSPLTLIAAPRAGWPRPLGILARELPPPTQPALRESRAPPGGTPCALQGKGWPELTPPPETVAGSALADRAEEGRGQREGGGREGAAGPYLPAPGSGQGPEAKPAGLHAPQSWEWAGAWGWGCPGGCVSQCFCLVLGHTYAHAQMGRAGWTTPTQNRCGDAAPDNKGVHQGDTSGLRAPWAPWEWGDHQGTVSQCMDQKGGECGKHRARQAYRQVQGLLPRVLGYLPFHHWTDPLSPDKESAKEVGARMSLQCLWDPRSSQVETRMPLKQM